MHIDVVLSHLQGQYHGVPDNCSQIDCVAAPSQEVSPVGV